jgi:hypothetical protein
MFNELQDTWMSSHQPFLEKKMKSRVHDKKYNWTLFLKNKNNSIYMILG